MATQFTSDDAGCYFDGARGIYIGEAVQEMATNYGWTGEPVGADGELYNEATDEALEYLNSLCDDSCYFEFDGDFMLRAVSDTDQD